jgi:hypothetical protein
MKQTAVEWYNEQLNMYGDMAFNKEISLGQYHIKKQELLDQAKEMEKEQERMYSEEEVYQLLYDLSGQVLNNKVSNPKLLEKWFEQFKKK